MTISRRPSGLTCRTVIYQEDHVRQRSPGPMPVGIFGDGRGHAYGIDDVVGNVREWVTDEPERGLRVVKGTGFLNGKEEAWCLREWRLPDRRVFAMWFPFTSISLESDQDLSGGVVPPVLTTARRDVKKVKWTPFPGHISRSDKGAGTWACARELHARQAAQGGNGRAWIITRC